MRYFVIGLICLSALFLGYLFLNKKDDFKISIPQNTREHYVGTVNIDDATSVRLIVLRHCEERVATEESRKIIEIANLAGENGLSITQLGDHPIDGNGPKTWSKVSLSNLSKFVSEQMKINRVPGDTFIIYTTGHGSPSGYLAEFGPRKEMMEALVAAADENEQETLWWQSSCYAAAGLPEISSLTEKQQELFSMIVSSVANKPSYWDDQNELMRKLFQGIKNNDPNLDVNGDDIITAKEFGDYIDRSHLVYAKSPDEPIFGWADLANKLPIIDRRTGRDIDINIPNPN